VKGRLTKGKEFDSLPDRKRGNAYERNLGRTERKKLRTGLHQRPGLQGDNPPRPRAQEKTVFTRLSKLRRTDRVALTKNQCIKDGPEISA